MLKLNVDSYAPYAVVSADGAIGDLTDLASGLPMANGTIFITKGSAAALTLRAPLSGPADSGGEDNRMLEITSTTAYQHVITTPTNKVNGATKTITLSGAAGDGVRLVAYSGVWYAQRSDHNALT